ncbi:MAG: ATP-binding protein [Acidimicrobiales bacterium]
MLVTAPDRSPDNGQAASNGGASPVPGADPTDFHGTYAGVDGALAEIRADVSRWFAERGFSAAAIDRAALTVSELSSNAIEAGPGHPLDVRLTFHAGPPSRAAITVTNVTLGGTPPPRDRWAPTDPLAPRGRGLAIVDALSDEVQVDSTVPGRVTVTAHLSDSTAPLSAD